MYAIVSPFTQSFDDIWFTYKFPENLVSQVKIWMILSVPFWNKVIQALVIETTCETSFDKTKIKEVIWIFSDINFLNNSQIELLKWISKYYFTLIHNSVSLFFPKNLLWKILKNKFQFNQNLTDLDYTFNYKKTLNISQQKIYDEILSSEKKQFLLYWVTWSWKTEIYINLIKHYLSQSKQSLLLVPEIILTSQIFERIKKVFWNEVLIINYTVTDAKKTIYWELIYTKKAKIIIWTRSALFYPYNDLGIIIIDEEHDLSLKQIDGVRYFAKDTAIMRAATAKIPIILGSATPSLESLYNCQQKKYFLLELSNKALSNFNSFSISIFSNCTLYASFWNLEDICSATLAFSSAILVKSLSSLTSISIFSNFLLLEMINGGT